MGRPDTDGTSLTDRLLARPGLYRLLGKVLSPPSTHATIVDEYIAAEEGHRILDLGCGPGSLVRSLPGTRYVGIDINAAYIEAADAQYGSRAEFLCGSFERAAELEGLFDRVLAIALLHHLADEDVVTLVKLAHEQLAPGGLLVTLDCVRREGQSRIARWLIDRDRGAWARTREQYLALVEPVFREVEVIERDDLLRVPYSHIIVRARRT